MPDPVGSTTGRFAVRAALLAIAAVCIALAARVVTPPPIEGFNTPPEQFSAARALAELERLLGNGLPHPSGSEANAQVRARLVDRLRELGLEPHIDSAYSCGVRFATCAPVSNVMALVPGASMKPPIMLAAHYDSVRVAPGAADDGAGVAALLESGRALSAGPALARGVLLVFTDAEELGLLGAEHFVRHVATGKRIHAFVNVDNRGTSGPSLMFETSLGNARLIELYGEAIARPAASSFYFEVYQHLATDTDFSVFARAGLQGFNFAFIGDAGWYHTPLDDLAHLDGRSLQQHGDNVLALARALAASDEVSAPHNASYVDLAGLVFVHWSAEGNRAWAALALLLLAAAGASALRRHAMRLADALFGLLIWLLAIGLGLGAAYLTARWVAFAIEPPSPWLAGPWPMRLMLWSAVAAAALSAPLLLRRAGGIAMALGTWTGWGIVSLALAIWLPGASAVVLLPTIVAAALLAGAEFGERGRTVALAIGFGVAGLIGAPAALLAELGLGTDGAVLIALFLLLPVTAAAPLVTQVERGWGVVALLGGLAVLGAVWAVLVPTTNSDRPNALNLYHVQDLDSGRAEWIAGSLAGGSVSPPPALLGAGFTRDERPAVPWLAARGPIYAAEAPARALTPARLEPLMQRHDRAAGRRILDLRLVPGSSPDVTLLLPGDLAEARLQVEGQPVEQGRPIQTLQGYRAFELIAVPAAGLHLRLELPSDDPVEVLVSEASPELPLGAAELRQARDTAATPISRGDLAVAYRRLSL